MIRWLLIILLTLAVGAATAVMLREDPGYVLIHIAGYSVETTLAALIGLTVLGLGSLVLAWRVLLGGVALPGRVAAYLRSRRNARAQTQFRSGLVHLAAADWKKAEIELVRRASDQRDSSANYLFAAMAAHGQGAIERRDSYLEQAGEQTHAAPAVLMQRAQMLSEEGRSADALVVLDQLAGQVQRHAPALELRLQLLEREQNWSALSSALADAKGLIAEDRLVKLSRHTLRHALEEAGRNGRLEVLRATWNAAPKILRSVPELLAVYAIQLHATNADAEGLRLIAKQLKQEWSPELALVYGNLHAGDVVSQLATVEDWIKRYGEKPELLLTAGRLCLRNRLWGRARSYFEAGLRLRPSAEFELELGRLALQSDDTASALNYFRSGLERVTDTAVGTTQEALAPPQVAKA